ncbi:hypothetical protein HF257_18375 [Pseudomonas sp. WS 5106]|uniref:Uncharacterized protein n=1 Tax=Pseudomonas cremoris TaxID=2724178 RepID=A0A7X1DZX6_9PSED|nr:hypothetical protein [Pseudomonas cremoris]MBC2380751.1 hypothetical protein [Pseudomonas cremoris]MBC2407979.1 hypothetical protein [Pseudomonas cremoris]
MKPTLSTAANGHLKFNLNECPDDYWLSLAEDLVKHEGFKRVGSPVFGFDETIHQGFTCAQFSLAAGWDTWFGHYLLSESAAADVFLQALFHQLSV